MIHVDSDSLECDLAQSYQIFDMRAFRPSRIAVFSCGLGEDSRIKRKLRDEKYPLTTMLQAAILDALNLLLWTRSAEDTPKPHSVLSILNGEDSAAVTEAADADLKPCLFSDPKEFEVALSALREEGNVYG